MLKFKVRADIPNHRGELPLHIACHSLQSVEVSRGVIFYFLFFCISVPTHMKVLMH